MLLLQNLHYNGRDHFLIENKVRRVTIRIYAQQTEKPISGVVYESQGIDPNH